MSSLYEDEGWSTKDEGWSTKDEGWYFVQGWRMKYKDEGWSVNKRESINTKVFGCGFKKKVSS